MLDSTLVFNELMYHPAGDQSELEWVELHNQMSIDLDLTGWSLRDGIEYSFPDGTIVPGGGYLVVAANPEQLSVATDLASPYGPYAGRLSNSGETLQLLNNSGRIMDRLSYRDDEGWPLGPDGSGVSLAKRDPLTASDSAPNWTFSAQIGGTPGRQNFDNEAPESVERTLIGPSQPARVYVPTSNLLDDAWREPDYLEGSRGETWIDATNGIGFQAIDEPAYEDLVLADNPLVYWRLRETSPETPPANAGLLGSNLDAQYQPTAQVGQGSLLDMIDDASLRISPSDESAPLTSGPFEKLATVDGVGGTGRSFEFWISLESTPTALGNLVGDGEGVFDFGMMVYVTPERRIRAFLRSTASESLGITSFESQRILGIGQRVHVVTTWDTSSGAFRLFLDGQEAPIVNLEGPLPNLGAARNTDNRVFVGKDGRQSGAADARIDEIAIYNYALSPQRIATHFGAGSSSLGTLIRTDVQAAMQHVSSTAFVRLPFEYADDLRINSLRMTVQYDDGFVAYLNGTEVARRNAPAGIVGYQATATQDRSLGETLIAETIDLTEFADQLESGPNQLAILALNRDAANDDFLILTTLDATGIIKPPDEVPAVRFNEVTSALDASFRLELVNQGSEPVDLLGYHLRQLGANQVEYVFPSSRVVQPGGLLTLSGSELGFAIEDGDRLFLFNPPSNSLLDAVRVTDRLRGRSEQHGGEWLYPSAATFGQPNQFALHEDVVINEILFHAPPKYVQGALPSDSAEEWIELYNRGSVPIDLSGWQLAGGIDYRFPFATTILPDQYLVVSNNAETLRAKYPEVASQIVGDFSRSLANDGDHVVLIDQANNPADQVQYYDGGRWPSYADGGGSSLELKDPFADNSVAESWGASDSASDSGWQTYVYRATAATPRGAQYPRTFDELSFGLLEAGEVLLDDLRVIEDPAGTARQLIQNGSFDSDLNTWRPVGNHHGQVVSDPTDPTNRVFHLTATGPEEHLQNHVETTLKDGDTFRRIRLNTEYEISFRAKWLAGSPQLNTRLYFNLVPRTTILDVPDTYGTPGRPNSTRVANLGPTYHDLAHFPLNPTAGESISVSILADDPDAVTSAQLWYSVDGGVFQTTSMSRGLDARFRGTIPGQATGSIVQIYVEARDTRGASSTFPAAGPDSRALIKVGDALQSPTALQTIRIVMTGTDADLLGERTNLMSNDDLGATVIYEGHVYYDVGVRLKGSEHGRPDPNRRGFAIEFDPSDRFRGVQSSVHIDRSGGWRFGTTFGQDEILIQQFFNRAGNIPSMVNDLVYVEAPTVATGTAILQMTRFSDEYFASQFENGADGTAYEYELIYGMLESSGRESLKYAQEGPLVLGIPVGTNLGDDEESYRHYFLIKNNRERDDYGPIMALSNALSQRGAAFHTATAEVMDLDQWMRSFAALSLSGAGDNYNSGNQHNAYFYQRPSDGKLLLLPFDMDFAFVNSPTAPLSSNPDLTRLRQSPSNEHLFLGHLHDILSTSFNAEYMARWVAHFDSLLPRQNLSSILSWISQREAYVRRQFPDEIPFALSSPDTSTSESFITIEGQGWINVRQIRIAGSDQPLDIIWTTPTQWQAILPVRNGLQNVTLEAFDFQGNPLGQDSLTVTGTGENPPLSSLRVTEINYHPYPITPDELAAMPNAVDEDFEFIELMNVAAEPIQLRGLTLDTGVVFSFPEFLLAPGELALVVQDAAAFSLRYGDSARIIGEFQDGRLANSGEQLRLVDAFGTVIWDVTYSDEQPWPDQADGHGPTLVLIDPTNTPAADLGAAERWAASSACRRNARTA